MARKSFFEKMANRMLRQAINETKKAVGTSRQSSGRQPASSQKGPVGVRYRTRYSLPSKTIKLASRGMHAYPVSGESFYSENFAALKEGLLTEETYTTAYLIHDSVNPVDGNAIAVTVEGLQQALVLGHIPRHAAPIFAAYLKGEVGECGARIYFDPNGHHNSVELNCAFPPRAAGEAEEPHENLLTSEAPEYSMTQVTTVGVYFHTIDFSAEEPRYGTAVLREGFRDSAEICDAKTRQILGYPYKSIAWDFNIFARSYGGEVRVAYKLDVNEKGRPRLALDASVLPQFKKSRY